MGTVTLKQFYITGRKIIRGRWEDVTDSVLARSFSEAVEVTDMMESNGRFQLLSISLIKPTGAK